jgi:hypothetical protein
MSMKVPMTPSGSKPATFQLIAQCLNQLCHRLTLPNLNTRCKCVISFKTLPFPPNIHTHKRWMLQVSSFVVSEQFTSSFGVLPLVHKHFHRTTTTTAASNNISQKTWLITNTTIRPSKLASQRFLHFSAHALQWTDSKLPNMTQALTVDEACGDAVG